MVIDQIENASLYSSMGERFVKAFQYLQSIDCYSIAPGKYEVSGENIYALIQQYWTGERKDCLEAHRRYADIHYIVDGSEVMGVANIDDLESGEYDRVADYVPMQGNAAFITVRAGTFVIFNPQDAHMPGLILDTPQPVKKIVMKVLLD
jgi:YhcH/YjgK/YiaL family protein